MGGLCLTRKKVKSGNEVFHIPENFGGKKLMVAAHQSDDQYKVSAPYGSQEGRACRAIIREGADWRSRYLQFLSQEENKGHEEEIPNCGLKMGTTKRPSSLEMA